MNEPFSTPTINIQSAIELLMPYSYSQEMMESLCWDVDNAEDPLMFDLSMAIVILGGKLMDKSSFIEYN